MKISEPIGRVMNATAKIAKENDHRSDGIDEEIEEFGGATNDHTNGNITRRDLVVPRIDQARIILQRSGGEGHGL